MKIEIFGEEEKKEEILRLRLKRGYGGESVTLVAVDEEGDPIMCGNLLTINENGSLTLHCSVSRDLGLKLDASGTIVVVNPQ